MHTKYYTISLINSTTHYIAQYIQCTHLSNLLTFYFQRRTLHKDFNYNVIDAISTRSVENKAVHLYKHLNLRIPTFLCAHAGGLHTAVRLILYLLSKKKFVNYLSL